jgi:hypothetical protein
VSLEVVYNYVPVAFIVDRGGTHEATATGDPFLEELSPLFVGVGLMQGLCLLLGDLPVYEKSGFALLHFYFIYDNCINYYSNNERSESLPR